MRSATDGSEQVRLVEITLRLIWAGADMHALDFLRWLVQNGRSPEWDLDVSGKPVPTRV